MNLRTATLAMAGLLGGSAFAQNLDSLEGLSHLTEDVRVRVDGAQTLLAQTGHEPGRGDGLYDRGSRALDKGDYAIALDSFSEVAARKGTRADGALYWKAYALNRLGRREDALKTLAALRSAYAASRWQDDARALDLEIRQNSGQPVAPGAEGNDDLKLIAINGLMQSDPDRALPILEKLLRSNNPPRVKDRALFVLAQSPSPRGRQVLMEVAKGGYNPDLQLRALRTLGMSGRDNVATLGSIYAASNDTQVKSQILKSFMMAGAHEQIYNAAKSEKSAELRAEAIRDLSMSGGHEQLWQLYQAERAMEVREQILNSFLLTQDKTHLMDVLKSEKEPRLRRAAIRALGMAGQSNTDRLIPMYASEQDTETRSAILDALFISQNAKGLIELARKEQDARRKQEIVQKLSLVHSKESTGYMLDLLK
jgi:tetratricopeptide (TPR) repeat protein